VHRYDLAPMSAQVLLADDDVELASMLKEYLEREGFGVATVHDGEAAARLALSGGYQIVVLDVMMPKLDGIEALRQIRQTSRVPVVMLTARGDDIDRIVGLELGADDYVPKPCTPRELVARLRAILRRAQPGANGGPLRDRRAQPVAGKAPRAMARARARADQHRVQRAGGADAQCRPRGKQARDLRAGARAAARALRPLDRCAPLGDPPEARRRRAHDPHRARAGIPPREGIAVGRLFWKIFIGFWLALVTAAAVTGTAVWLQHHRQEPPTELAGGPPSRIATDMAAATLAHGGVEALRSWMKEVESRRPLQVFAVDEGGRDVLGAKCRRRTLAAAARARRARRAGRAAGCRAGRPKLSRLRHPRAGEGRDRRRARRAAADRAWEFIVIGIATSLASARSSPGTSRARSATCAGRSTRAAAGRLETRVSPLMGRRRDEIADLGRDFDRMALQLQKLVSAQRRLLHDVSHELRSPLARLQAAIGLARQEPAKVEPSLERIEREASRLDQMVGEVLALARLEGGTATRPKERVDLAYLAANIAEDARFEAEAAGRALRFHAEGDAPVMGDADLLHRAVENVGAQRGEIHARRHYRRSEPARDEELGHPHRHR